MYLLLYFHTSLPPLRDVSPAPCWMLPTVPSVASIAPPMNNDDRAWWRNKAGRRYGIIRRTLCTWMCQSSCRSITTSLKTATSLKYWTHSSIRAYLSHSRAKKNTNAIQYAGMIEIVQCCLIIKQRHEKCISLNFHLPWTTPVIMLPVLSLSDSKYTWTPLAQAHL